MSAHSAKNSAYPCFIILKMVFLLGGCGEAVDSTPQSETPERPAISEGFAFSHDPARVLAQGPQACAECHAEIFADWQMSHHAKANRPISAALDKAAFTPARRLVESGVTYELAYENERFELRVLDAAQDLERVYELTGVIGYTPLRQYLAPLPGG
ncbi:MAG: multiheme c-type cytochrome, partial [Opitutales bacterium]